MSLEKIIEIVGRLTIEQREAVKEIGFDGILEIKCKKIKRDLCSFLVQNYDTNLRCLNVHGRKLVLTPWDVNNILGLRNEGLNVVFEEDDDFPLDGVKNGRIKLKFLYEKLKEMETHDREFKMTFALYIFGAFLCPTTNDSLCINYLKALYPKKINSFNWAKYVLSFLENSLMKLGDNEQKSPSGCLLLLKLKYLDHVGARSQNFDQVPRIAAWGDDEIKRRLAYIKKAGRYQNETVEMIEDFPDKTSSFIKAIADEVEKVIVPPMIKHIECTINQMLNVPSKAPIEETPAFASSPPIPLSSHQESLTKAASPPHSNTPPLAPTIPAPLPNVGKSEKMSSNIAKRVKKQTQRQPSRHVTSPYEVAHQTYKIKITKLGVSDEKKSDASLVVVSDTSLPSSVNAKDEEAIKEFTCPPCILPHALFYYINYVKAGLNEELVLLSGSNEFLTRRDIIESLKGGSWISSNVSIWKRNCTYSGTRCE